MAHKHLGLAARTYPELDQEKGMGGPAIIQLPQTALLLWELVVDLPDVHTLQGGCAGAGAVLADVDEQVPLVLSRVSLVRRGQWTSSLPCRRPAGAVAVPTVSASCPHCPPALGQALHCPPPSVLAPPYLLGP